MTEWRVETVEMFETNAVYLVEADAREEAIRLVIAGGVAYESHEHPGNCDEFVQVICADETQL